MNLKEERFRLLIEPRNEVEIAYIEEVLNLKAGGDTCIARRINATARLEIKKDDKRDHATTWKPSTLEEHITESSITNEFAFKVGLFSKLMYKRIENIKNAYPDAITMQLQINYAIAEGNWVDVAVFALLLKEAYDAKKA